MRGVAAVVTTGIYCRPGCSANPKAHNVLRFPIPAAAEAAGYRACLRCRPYRLPPVPSAPQPELVCRAVQMILDGALDQGTEAALAQRIGVSARHLRRMFMTELGVTPDGLARSARAHFARRLLDETDLTITEIAFVAGFGSPRQFNRVCREVFRASPSDLRAKRRRSDRLVADGGLALRLAYDGELDWPAMVKCLGRDAIAGVEWVGGDVYRRTVLIEGHVGVLELLPGGDDHLILRAHLPKWRELLHVVRRARHIANLDSDRARTPGGWDPYETMVRAVIATTLHARGSSPITALLAQRHGVPAPGLRELGLTHAFPTPEALATADLTRIGLSRSTAAAINALSAGVADGSIRLDDTTGTTEFTDSLAELPGMAAATAHYATPAAGPRYP